ncbi:uncharacterized protein LOC121867050 isoform X2 [Homarus americanus]|uniref:uncharacterized protein LOC121867050 isoform X2 n=1 Tax=Homarus americanus TaxID=6706 RepID=UPI001C478099|nr:uncharacterized protein LOC121867050 isoform X2 [Homarus americanus]
MQSIERRLYGRARRSRKLRRQKLREAMLHMKVLEWRRVCDDWVAEQVENRPGASTPVCELYNAYIEDNPHHYMDIGQFGKVLSSQFPDRKRRRGKQGAQIYVYQGVALKSRVNIASTHSIMNNPAELPDPPPPPLQIKSEFSESYNLLDQTTIRNPAVGPILLSVPKETCRATVIKEEAEDRDQSLVAAPFIQTKRKSMDENCIVSPVHHKKLKATDERNDSSSTDFIDNSTLLLREEIKEEIEVKEESVLPLDILQSEQTYPQTQTFPSTEEPENVDLRLKRHSKVSPTRTSLPRDVKRSSPTSIKHRMPLARQWVDANLVDKKGAVTTASAIEEAYAQDHPNDPLPQTTMSVVIRGKFPTRRKRSELGFYYQDLDLVKRRDDVSMMSHKLTEATTLQQYPVKIQINTSPLAESGVWCPKIISVKTTKEDRKPDDTAKTEDMQHIIVSRKANTIPSSDSSRERKTTIFTKVSPPSAKEETPSNVKNNEGRKKAIVIGTPRVKPTIVTDRDGGLSVAVCNPPPESVFDYEGVPCVMIPVSQASNHIYVETEKLLPNSKAKAIAKMFSNTSQVLSRVNKPGILSSPLPGQNATRPSPVTVVKCDNNLGDRGLPSPSALGNKIQIKTVSNLNESLQSQSSDKLMSLECSTERQKTSSLSSSMEEKKHDSLTYCEKRGNSTVCEGYMYSTITGSETESFDKENDDSHLVIDDTQATSCVPEPHLEDMDVLDYIKSEMAEDDAFSSVDMRMKSEQHLVSYRCGISGDASEVSQKHHLRDKVQLTDCDTKYTMRSGITRSVNEVGECEVEFLNQVTKTNADVKENFKFVAKAESKINILETENTLNLFNGEVDEGNNITSDEHELNSDIINVRNVVSDIECGNNKGNEDTSKIFSVENESKVAEPHQRVSKVGKKSVNKKIRSWDEDIRSFVVNNSGADIFKYKNFQKRITKRKKQGSGNPLHPTSTGCSKSIDKTLNVKSELSNTENLIPEEDMPLSCQSREMKIGISESDDRLRAISLKKAVLDTTFKLLSERSAGLTEAERACKLEAALFEENPAVSYAVQTANTKNLPQFPCLPSSTLEDLNLCSEMQSTLLLQHHQACPGLGCQRCNVLRAAYVHITLFRHRCQVWHAFTKIVSKHSLGCNKASCSLLFCQFMKHELHLSGVSVLPNHLMEQCMLLEAEFMKCRKAGPHGADLHCGHQQDVRLPQPGMMETTVETRGLKLVTDLLMPNKPKTHDISLAILKTLEVAAAHYHTKVKTKD